ISDRIVRLKDFGRIDRRTQDHDEIGYNFKFTDIQAALGIEQMKKLKWRLKRKKEMYELYEKLLQNIAQVQFVKTDLAQTSPWFIDIIVPDPIGLCKYLKEKNIGSRLFYPAIHTTKPYKGTEIFPNSLWAARHGLWLPSSTFLTDSDIISVCDEIRKFYEAK
ncbi:DegT/DnrJ/EryC1/StrS family aminotransferase, partial [Patescibacteria group bacterium]|nr:DegT/DnrJ/EryC1/StrS family aminotransferase [Patescibacteria group bacterium]